MTDQQQTEAQRLAALLRSRNNNPGGFGLGPICDKAADELLRLNSAHAALERVRMQLVACGVVARADTPDSAREARAMHPEYESLSCDDVKRRVDECIALRARVAELEDVLTNLPLSSPQRLRARIQQLEEMLAAVGAGGVGPLIPATVQHQRDSSSDNDLQRKTGDLITTAAPPQTGGIPPNWQLVPMEATGEMIDAARGLSSFPDGVYRAMLAAAPQPPTVEECLTDELKPRFSAHDDAERLKSVARGMSYNDHGEAVWKHTLMEIAVRLESGGYAAPQPPGEQPPTTEQSSAVGVIGWKNHRPNSGTVVHWTTLMPPLWTKLYTHPQSLRCKSNQARLATLWGYVKAEPLTDEQINTLFQWGCGQSFRDFARAIERAVWEKAHG